MHDPPASYSTNNLQIRVNTQYCSKCIVLCIFIERRMCPIGYPFISDVGNVNVECQFSEDILTDR